MSSTPSIKPNLALDLMEIRLEYPSKDHPEFQRIMAELRFCIYQCVPGYTPLKVHPKLPVTRVSIAPFPDKRFAISYGCVNKSYFSWFRFNPTKLGDDGMGIMAGYLSMTMLDKGSSSLLNHGQVSRLEIAVDIDGVHIDEFCFLHLDLKAEDATLIHMGTLKLGSKLRSLTIYQKDIEIKKKKGIDIGCPRLRIEHIEKNANKHPCQDLPLIPNPFANFIVVSKQALLAGPFDMDLMSLRGRMKAKSCSLVTAYYSLTTAERKSAVVGLRKLIPDWWSPTEIWKQYPEALSKLTPLCNQSY